jgi:hypothetical protein
MASRAAPGADGTAAAQRRVLAAIVLITVAALTTIRWPIKTMGQIVRTSKGDEVTLFLARCDRLAPHLPATGRIGYFVRPEEFETRKSLHTARLELMQYALAPRVIETFSGQEFVIFDSDEPAAFPTAAASRDWQLVADLHDGFKLYGTSEHK